MEGRCFAKLLPKVAQNVKKTAQRPPLPPPNRSPTRIVWSVVSNQKHDEWQLGDEVIVITAETPSVPPAAARLNAVAELAVRIFVDSQCTTSLLAIRAQSDAARTYQVSGPVYSVSRY